MYTSVLASSVTIGFGGSVGAEAPIVFTGAAIGSNLGRVFNMDQRTMMLLLGCGATAGIAGIFKAPIAGLLFTIEVLMLDLTAFSIMPLLISSVTAASVAYIGSLPLAMGLACGKSVLTVAVLAILITAPLGAFAIDKTYKRLLEQPEEESTDK